MCEQVVTLGRYEGALRNPDIAYVGNLMTRKAVRNKQWQEITVRDGPVWRKAIHGNLVLSPGFLNGLRQKYPPCKTIHAAESEVLQAKTGGWFVCVPPE